MRVNRLSAIEKLEIVKKLSDARSPLIAWANTIWFFIALLCITYMSGTEIPGLGNLAHRDDLWLILLSIAILAWAATHASTVRSDKLFQPILEQIGDIRVGTTKMAAREYYDLSTHQHINRVSTLAQLLRGRHQFYRDQPGISIRLVFLSVAYHSLLKIVSIVIIDFMPAFVISIMIIELFELGRLTALPIFFASISIMVLLHVIYNDVDYLLSSYKYMATVQSGVSRYNLWLREERLKYKPLVEENYGIKKALRIEGTLLYRVIEYNFLHARWKIFLSVVAIVSIVLLSLFAYQSGILHRSKIDHAEKYIQYNISFPSNVRIGGGR
jgi:hypothetical protein